MFIIHATRHVWYCRKNVNGKPEKYNQERAANSPFLLSHLGLLFTPALNSRLLVLCVCTFFHLKWILKKRERKRERVPGCEFVTTYQTVLRCPGGKCAGPCVMCSCCAVAPCGFSRLTSVSQLLPKCSERLQEVRFFFRNYTTPFCFLASPRREQKTLIFLDQGRRD